MYTYLPEITSHDCSVSVHAFSEIEIKKYSGIKAYDIVNVFPISFKH